MYLDIWDLEKFEYPWPTPDDTTLYKNFTLEHYSEATKNTPVKHAVFVQVLNKNTDEIGEN